MQLPHSLTWVGFDLDGTLVNTAADICAAINTTLEHYQVGQVTVDDVQTWIGNGIDKATERALAKVGATHIDVSAAAAKVSAAYNQCVTDSSTLYVDAKATLQALQRQGLKLLLVTNKNESHTHALVNALGVADYFDAIVCGDTLPQRKPDPAMLFSALNNLSLDISEGVYVGDSKNDVATARNAGCPVICVNYGYNHGLDIADANPDKIITRLGEVETLLAAR